MYNPYKVGYFLRTETIIDVAHQLKAQGKKVVFTHGAFDLFHAGHSLFLEKSKEEGKVLIVGVDSNYNIKRYKNVLRPIIDQKQRVDIISRHNSVDFVFLIDEMVDIDPEHFTNFYTSLYKALEPTTVTLGKKSQANTELDNREKELTYAGTKFKKLDTEVTSTTKIITSILNIYK